jgi:hypothetical protein
MDQCMYNPDCVAWMYYINTENRCAPDPQTGLVPEYDSATGLGCKGKVRLAEVAGCAAHAWQDWQAVRGPLAVRRCRGCSWQHACLDAASLSAPWRPCCVALPWPAPPAAH